MLCGLGLLTTEALQDLVARHARQVLEKALPWTKGSYQFEPTTEEPTWFERMPSSLSTADIILDAARAIEDSEVIAWHLGDIDRVVVPATEAAVEATSCRLTAFDGFVLSRADGRLTAREIMSIVPKDAEDVLRALFGLLCLGLRALREARAARSESSEGSSLNRLREKPDARSQEPHETGQNGSETGDAMKRSVLVLVLLAVATAGGVPAQAAAKEGRSQALPPRRPRRAPAQPHRPLRAGGRSASCAS